MSLILLLTLYLNASLILKNIQKIAILRRCALILHAQRSVADFQLQVRDTAAWCIGRVCDSCEEVVIRQEILTPLLPALSNTLQQEPRVASNVCWVCVFFLLFCFACII